MAGGGEGRDSTVRGRGAGFDSIGRAGLSRTGQARPSHRRHHPCRRGLDPHGHPEQLLPWEGEPLVVRTVRQTLQARVAPVVVVLGHKAGKIGPLLEPLLIPAKSATDSGGKRPRVPLQIVRQLRVNSSGGRSEATLVL